MPPKPKPKPKVVPRRGAAASTPTDGDALGITSTDPTATAASTETAPATATEPPKDVKPIAPPKGRLDSLASSSRGSSTKIPLKFKPKVVARRSEKERETLAAKYQEAEPATSTSTTAGRGRGADRGDRGGRGRGRGRGRGGFHDHAPAMASGPFALGSTTTAGQKVMAERGRYGGGFGSSSNRNRISFKGNMRIKKEDGTEVEVKAEYSSSDESDGQRVDVEYISLLDESDDEDGDHKMSGWGGAGAPVRIPRSEHVDRQAMVNTESSTRKGKAVLQQKAKEMTFETEIKVKNEPADDNEFIILPALSSSPGTKKKVRMSRSPETKKKDGPSGAPIKHRRRSSSTKRKPVISTTEETEEYKRAEKDRLAMLQELGGVLPNIEGEGKDKEGDIAMTDVPPTTNPETENETFFFQFPTLLPQLVPTIPAEPEPEPDPEPVDVDKKPPPPLSRKAQTKAALAALTEPPASGLIGQLRVHRSGRISLLWGRGEEPFEMDVNRGVNAEFLQEVVVIKQDSPYGDEDVDEKGVRKGVAYSLGQIKGKYVVNPDFEKLIVASAPRRRGRTAVKKDNSAITIS